MEDAKVLAWFGKRVHESRLAKGWSQERLGLESGLDRTYVSSVERGHRNISIINIFRLAAALDMEPHRLLQPAGGDDGKN